MKDTEKLNKNSIGISKFPMNQIVRTIIDESTHALTGVSSATNDICKIIPVILNKMKAGGRVIYIGAGTSGRIAAQDVVELFPTYGMGAEFFHYVICGGKKALYRSVEGAEDNKKQAIIDIKRKKLCENDVLIGISASGETPYVLSAIGYANKINSSTIGITNNSDSSLIKISNHSILLKTGAEVIQGSTRMNAGTAQKITLNTISTTIAILFNRTFDNIMDHMKSNFNEKLRNMALTIIMTLFKIDRKEATSLLVKYDYNIEKVITFLNKNKQDQ